MQKIDSFIAFIIDLNHGDALYAYGNNWHYQLLSIEIKRGVFSFTFEAYLCLLMVSSFLFIEDKQRDFVAIKALLKRVKADID